MRIVVTGGAGFIGSALTPTLRQMGHDVSVVDDLRSGSREHVPAGVRLHVADAADLGALEDVVGGADAIVHLAAVASVPLSLRDPLAAHRANSAATLSVLESARRRGVGRVILASSAAVYGDGAAVQAEAAPPSPKSLYGVDKVAGEMRLRVYREVFALPGLALRFFNVYGPRQAADSAYGSVVPIWIRAALSGEAPRVNGDGLQTRDFVHVDDAVQAIGLALAAPSDLLDGRAVNVATGRGVSLLELLAAVCRETGAACKPVFEPVRAGDIRSSVADVELARRHLGFTAAISLEEGIRRTVAWSREALRSGCPGGGG